MTHPAHWFPRDKYGLFIHFGLYALLGGEYQGKTTRGIAEWIQLNEDIPAAEYEALADRFDPIHFDADAIARQAKRWGMRYICFTAKHHDGYALFDSASDPYNSVQRAARPRDYVAELAAACRTHGLTLCLYYSQAQDWHHPDGYRAYRDNSAIDFRRYLDSKCLPQLHELLTNYGDIGMIWFDTPMGMTLAESREIRDYVKQLQPNCLINGRIGHDLGDYLTTQDNRIPAYPVEGQWEVPATLNHSWGYKRSDSDWRSADGVIHQLLKIVSRGWNYLLNIGPRGDGSIPAESVAILDQVGAWLQSNGEAIYGSSAIEPYVYEAEELCFTHKPHALYIHVLHPERYRGREIPLPNIANEPLAAYWLSHDAEDPLRVTQTLEGDPYWGIRVPDDLPDTPVLTLKVETREEDFVQKRLGQIP